jgi:hypothetical protein
VKLDLEWRVQPAGVVLRNRRTLVEAEARSSPSWVGPALRIAARAPFTLTLLSVLVIGGIAVGGFASPINQTRWYELVAYELSSFTDGRWWTALTGTFLVAEPLGYLVLLLAAGGVGFLELRRRAGVAIAYYVGGQLFAAAGSARCVPLGRARTERTNSISSHLGACARHAS